MPPTLTTSGARLVLWALFFLTTVYGHVGLKLAVDREPSFVRAAFSPWGLSAFAAWTASSVLWMVVLQRETLLSASSVSSLRYALTVIAAVLFLREAVTVRTAAGVALIAVGTYLAAKT